MGSPTTRVIGKPTNIFVASSHQSTKSIILGNSLVPATWTLTKPIRDNSAVQKSEIRYYIREEMRRRKKALGYFSFVRDSDNIIVVFRLHSLHRTVAPVAQR